MSDFGTMVDRIEADLDRDASSDTDAIKREIITAINDYKTERFRFNEAKLSLTTVADQAEYDEVTLASDLSTVSIEDVVSLDDLYYVAGSYNWEMDRRPFGMLRSIESTSFTGRPTLWSIGNGILLLSPTPDDAYSLTGDMVYDFNAITASSASNETNAWFTTAEKLVRMQAMGSIYSNHLRDLQKAQWFWAQAAEEFRRLKRDYEVAAVTEWVTPYYC